MGLIEIKFDGACHNKVGQNNVMGIGVAVFFDSEYVEEESKAIRIVTEHVRGTSNIAEWEGCVEAWKIATQLTQQYPGNDIRIYSDSQLISCQFNDEYAINQQEFLSYYTAGKELQSKLKLKNEKIIWIKRDFNKEADKLSKDGLKMGLITRRELGNHSAITNM